MGFLDNSTNNIIVEKYNALISKTDDTNFIPHLATWLYGERWEEDISASKPENDNFGLAVRDPYRNLSFWKKGRRMPQDIDSDIIKKFYDDEIPYKSMINMGFSESQLK